jgi:hypothetical protein
MATASKREWTPAHESALSGLGGLGIGKKEARAHLEGLSGSDVAELMRQALASRNRSQAPPPAVAGGPSGARPIVSPPPPAAAAAPPQQGPPPGAPPTAAGSGRILPPWIRAPIGPGAPLPNARMPLDPKTLAMLRQAQQPAQSQLQPQAPPQKPPYTQVVGAPPGWQPSDAGLAKPRVRVRAAGGPVPAAPLGGPGPSLSQAPPTKAPQTPTKEEPLPRIRSEEEYEKIAAGTRFVWIPDGHIYRKPAQKGD